MTANLFNPNAFDQQPAIGAVDLSVNENGIWAGILGTGATGIVPGQPVKLDTTATGKMPVFVAAADTDVAFGVIMRVPMQSTFAAGDRVQVVSHYRGPIVYAVANEDLVPMDAVAVRSDFKIEKTSTNTKAHRGYAIEKIKSGAIGRYLQTGKPA